MNGKLLFSAGQIAEIMAQVTDAAFVPVGHDQITASFFPNGFCASATPLGAPRGKNHSYQHGCFYQLQESNILFPLAW